MNVEQWLKDVVTILDKVEIPTARLDALVLLEQMTGKDRAYLLAHQETELTSGQMSELANQITRRIKHEPLAYIRGKSEFYGREFIVNQHTLEPRPESETMIELLKELVNSTQSTAVSSLYEDQPWKVVDVGTGSGCLAITAKLELPNLEVFGTDIDKECIQVANANTRKHKVSIDFRQGNLLEPGISNQEIGNRKWIILANLPYVPDGHTINMAAMFEPKHAIFGGSDGLDLYREVFQQINELKHKPYFILAESLPFQHEQLAEIAKESGYTQEKQDDFIQLFILT